MDQGEKSTCSGACLGLFFTLGFGGLCAARSTNSEPVKDTCQLKVFQGCQVTSVAIIYDSNMSNLKQDNTKYIQGYIFSSYIWLICAHIGNNNYEQVDICKSVTR